MTLQPTALVNELCVTLLSLRTSDRFRGSLAFNTPGGPVGAAAHCGPCAQQESAEARRGAAELSLDEARDQAVGLDDQIADLNDALTRLEALDHVQRRWWRCVFSAG